MTGFGADVEVFGCALGGLFGGVQLGGVMWREGPSCHSWGFLRHGFSCYHNNCPSLRLALPVQSRSHLDSVAGIEL